MEMLSIMSALNMDASKAGVPTLKVPEETANSRLEVRCAVRFPLVLPVILSSGREEIAAITRNVSASGVLFEVDRPQKVGQDIRFSLRMPGAVLGTSGDILVHCLGRVVRCSISQSKYQTAATIDEYQFAEH